MGPLTGMKPDDQQMTPNQMFWFFVLVALTALCLITAGALVVNMVQAESRGKLRPMERTPSTRSYERRAPKPERFMPPGQEHMIDQSDVTQPPEVDKALPEFEERDG